MTSDTIQEIFYWDWKAQPPTADIAAVFTKIFTAGREVHTREYDTKSDQCALIVADREVSDEEAEEISEASNISLAELEGKLR